MSLIKINKNQIYNLYNIVGFIFLFLTMFIPDSYRVIRLAVFAMFTFICCKKCDFKLSGEGTGIILIYLISNLFFCIYGMLLGAPGALRTQTVDLIWPIMFWIVAQTISTNEQFEQICRVLIFCEFIVCLYDCFYLLTQFGFLPQTSLSAFLETTLSCNYGHYGNYIQYTTTHMCTHIFMVPFSITLFFSKTDKTIISNSKLLILLILELICVLLSGRVAFQVTSAFSLVLALLFMKIGTSKSFRSVNIKLFGRIIAIIIGLFFLAFMTMRIFEVDIDGIISYITYKLESSNNMSDTINGVRILQKNALIAGWKESPILGHGAGSYAKDVIRDASQLWAYEYSYYAMLYQKGLLGTTIFFGFVIWIIYKIITKVKCGYYRKDWAIPMVIGLICIIIANYADPYLNKFGCMWMLYLPFAAANASVLQKIKQEGEE